MNNPEKEKDLRDFYCQVGDMTKCGHCEPEKYSAVEPCSCKCHSPVLEEEKKCTCKYPLRTLTKNKTTYCDDCGGEAIYYQMGQSPHQEPVDTQKKCYCKGVIKNPRCTHTLENCWVKHISHIEVEGNVGPGTTSPYARLYVKHQSPHQEPVSTQEEVSACCGAEKGLHKFNKNNCSLCNKPFISPQEPMEWAGKKIVPCCEQDGLCHIHLSGIFPTQEPMEWELRFPLNTFHGETKFQLIDFISKLIKQAEERHNQDCTREEWARADEQKRIILKIQIGCDDLDVDGELCENCRNIISLINKDNI